MYVRIVLPDGDGRWNVTEANPNKEEVLGGINIVLHTTFVL